MEEIRFTVTREDHWHYQLYALLRVRNFIVDVLVLLFIGGIFGIYYSVWWGILAPLILVVGLIGITVFRIWRDTSNATQMSKKEGIESITISEQGIRYKNELRDSTTSWRAIKAIREDKHNLYFHRETGDSRSIQAFLIPRHAFVSPQEAARFLERARGYWREQSSQIAAPNIQ